MIKPNHSARLKTLLNKQIGFNSNYDIIYTFYMVGVFTQIKYTLSMGVNLTLEVHFHLD